MDNGLDPILREALVALFRAHPDKFVLIGGAALRLLYDSPRSSADADLLVRKSPTPAELSEIALRLEEDLAPASAHLGRTLSCRASPETGSIVIQESGRPLLLVQFPCIPPPAHLAKRLLHADSLGSEIVPVPTLDEFLLSKLITLLQRRIVKGRDAFDIWYLSERGARLKKAALEHWLQWEDWDSRRIAARLAQLTPKRLAQDLARFLPADLDSQLKGDGYLTLRESVRSFFAEFL